MKIYSRSSGKFQLMSFDIMKIGRKRRVPLHTEHINWDHNHKVLAITPNPSFANHLVQPTHSPTASMRLRDKKQPHESQYKLPQLSSNKSSIQSLANK